MQKPVFMRTKQFLLRLSHGYAEDHVSAHLNISKEDYTKLESGEKKLTADQAKSLGELYNLDPQYFLSDDYSVVNHNNGTHSHSGPIHIYNSNHGLKELIDKLLVERDEQNKEIASLKLKINK